jgi:hypothetical protein
VERDIVERQSRANPPEILRRGPEKLAIRIIWCASAAGSQAMRGFGRESRAPG